MIEPTELNKTTAILPGQIPPARFFNPSLHKFLKYSVTPTNTKALTERTITTSKAFTLTPQGDLQTSQVELLISKNGKTKENKSPVDLEEKKIENRLFVQDQLRDIYKCLLRVNSDQSLMIILEQKLWVSCRLIKASAQDSQEIKAALDYIYWVINKAFSLNIYIFFDWEGRIISLTDLDKMVENKYKENFGDIQYQIKDLLGDFLSQELVKKIKIEEELDYIESIEKLELPSEVLRKFDGLEQFFLYLLQRTYPSNESLIKKYKERKDTLKKKKMSYPIVSPNTLIILAGNFKINNVVSLVDCLLCLPEIYVPYTQKVFILNFLKNFIKVNGVEKNILEKNYFKEDLMLRFICEEIKFLNKNHDLVLKNKVLYPTSDQLLLFDDSINGLIEKNIFDGDEFFDFIEIISDDIKFNAAASFTDLNYDSCVEKKDGKINEPAIFSYKLSVFVRKKFMDVLSSHDINNDRKLIRRKNVCLYNFFANLAFVLFEKKDFISSSAIISALASDYVKKVSVNKKNKKINKKAIALIQRISMDMFSKEIETKMYVCLKNNEFFIPEYTLICKRVIQRAEGIKMHVNSSSVNNIEESSLLAAERSEVNKFFDDIRFKVSSMIKDFKIKTNIYNIIMSTLATEEVIKKYNEIFDGFASPPEPGFDQEQIKSPKNKIIKKRVSLPEEDQFITKGESLSPNDSKKSSLKKKNKQPKTEIRNIHYVDNEAENKLKKQISQIHLDSKEIKQSVKSVKKLKQLPDNAILNEGDRNKSPTRRRRKED